MALSDKSFVDKINSCLTGTLSEIQNAQLADSIPKISSYKIDSVATFSVLPVASENTGRMVFVISEDVYYYSDGVSWTKDLTSNLVTSLYSWGNSSDGQLGDNTTVNKSSPVSVIGGFTDWCQVSSSRQHVAAVRSNGTLWTWGEATCGKLGDNTTVSKSSPVSVVGDFTDWCQVSAGRDHTAAVRTNGTLWAWGVNACGTLGDGTTVNKSSPISVAGGFTDWCQVSAGGCHTAAVRTNGTLWSWGNGYCGKLGNDDGATKSSPVSVVGGFTDWCQVSAGCFHTVAVRTNGTLWAWGLNSNAGDFIGGLLGDGTKTDRCSPVSVIGGFTDWCQVSAGDDHTAAVRQNGTLWAWGGNEDGQLGINIGPPFIGDKSSPVSVVGGFTDWCQVAVGKCNTVALRYTKGF